MPPSQNAAEHLDERLRIRLHDVRPQSLPARAHRACSLTPVRPVRYMCPWACSSLEVADASRLIYYDMVEALDHAPSSRRSGSPNTRSIATASDTGEHTSREPKPDSELRVLIVGDSFVFGDFVEDEETLPAQLEAKLRARCSDVRVINSGLGGSTITEHVELLYRSLELDPDVVILLFSENDVHDLVGTPMWKQLAQNRAVKSRFPYHSSTLWSGRQQFGISASEF